MSTVESPQRGGEGDAPPRSASAGEGGLNALLTGTGLSLRTPSRERLIWGAAVAGLLLLAFGLRIWGNGHGLPYAYNSD